MFAGLCASLAGVASQAGDADSSRAPGLTSGSWTEPGVLACTLQFTGILKNPAKCLWRWEPDRRNNFFGPPAHLCRHMWLKYRCMWRKTPIVFFKCLNNPLVSPHCFKFPLVHLCAWGYFLCFWTLLTAAAHFVWKLQREKSKLLFSLTSRSEVFRVSSAFIVLRFYYACLLSLSRQMF